ncbi:MAG: 50S ribosomal protein L30 [Eubacteriales bacterium]|nr:50S ribosomal protein L30 [Eubacteriales bacterium]
MNLKITLKKSTIARKPKHIKTVEALGLRKIGQTVIKPDNESIRGQVFAVKHLVEVEELKEGENS